MASLKQLSLALLAALAVPAGCTEPNVDPIPAGTYEATTYNAGPTAERRTNILALGVSWKLIVGEDRSVVSQWHVERDSLVSNSSHAGTFSRRDAAVRFIGFSTSDPILTERVWTLEGDQLTSLNQVVSGVNAEIRFTRR